ncbi:MAG: hypothetical protein KDB21_10155, partial [Acidimicrobiales bacterium]|nr:hypothetical protein [Acidimicrobiales bacterium]
MVEPERLLTQALAPLRRQPRWAVEPGRLLAHQAHPTDTGGHGSDASEPDGEPLPTTTVPVPHAATVPGGLSGCGGGCR